MSLLTNNKNWLSLDGNPTQGMTPPSVRVRAGALTPARRSMLAAAYDQFCTAKKLSIAGGGYFTGDKRLPDGTKVRMVSINGIDHVHVWAEDPKPTEGVGVTFWCQPWDEAWVDEQYEETFTIPRWFDIDDTDADEDNDAVDFLVDLARNTEYEPRASTDYPGNLTWFAPEPHPSSGVVVSWWGQMRRYSRTPLENAIDSPSTWARPPAPADRMLDILYMSALQSPTGGIAGALGGHIFHSDTTPDALPGSITSTPSRASVPAKELIWVNGEAIATPAGFGVLSACIGYRSGVGVLRAVRSQLGFDGSTLRVIEQSATIPDAWNILADLNISASGLSLVPSRTVNGSVPSGSAWLEDPISITQPFYWNADGTEALGIVMYRTGADIPAVQSNGAHVLLKITVGESSCTVSVVDHPMIESDLAHTITKTSTGPAFVNYTHTFAMSSNPTYTYDAVIAADFKGNDPIIIRTHIDAETTRTESETKQLTTTYAYIDALVAETTDYNRDLSISASSSTDTWASANGVEISATRKTRSTTFTRVFSRTENTDEGFVADGEGGYYVEDTQDDMSESDDVDYSASGLSSLWGVCAGDLRAEYFLHATPIDGGSGEEESYFDLLYSKTATASSSLTTSSSSESATYSRTLRTDLGELYRIGTGAPSLVTRLFFPNRLEDVGSGTWSKTQSGGGSPVESTTSTGPYGDGPTMQSVERLMPLFTPTDGGATNANFGPTTYPSSRTWAKTRNYAGWPYPYGLELTVSGYNPEAYGGAGGHTNTVLAGCALTPDLRVQYTGAVFVALAEPSAPLTPVAFKIDRWTVDGDEFTPVYPDQEDPEDPEATIDFPHRGGHAILLDPIFIGPPP